MSDLTPSVQLLEVEHVVAVHVMDDMRLLLKPIEIARAGEHNSATFRIMRQPESLDGYVCRAEVRNSAGTNYRLVENGEFSLTSDIAVQGIGSLQLVYSDGDAVIRKTYEAKFHVSPSLDAVDESDPEFQNGLAQLQAQAFASVRSPTAIEDVATFYNISGNEVAYLTFPPAVGGGDLTEERADTLYLKLNGANAMQASVGIIGPNRGISWGESSIQGAIYSTGSQLVMRRSLGNPDIVMENNSGDTGSRSPILTKVMGDSFYVTPDNGDIRYLQRAGGQMTGPLITATGTGVTNPGLAIGDNSTGFYRTGNTLVLSVSGQIFAQWLPTPLSMMSIVPLNMASQLITNVSDPRDGAAGAQDAVNRRTVEAAIAAIPRPTVPAARAFIANEITIGTDPTQFFNQPFFTNDNSPRTILVTVYPQFDSGTPGSFYDLEYSTNLSVGLVSRFAVYPTGGGVSYMGVGTICFAATVTPVSSQIQVSLSARMMGANPTPIVQIGSRTAQRSTVVIQEMTQ